MLIDGACPPLVGIFLIKYMDIKKFKEKGISFDFDNDIVNATDMMKNFPEKKMNNFLRKKQTKEFIKVLEVKHKNLNTLKSASLDFKAVTTIKGNAIGRKQGTWMHKILALKFAAWLSPEFELFVFETFENRLNEKIRNAEIMESIAWNKLDNNDLYK